MSLVTSIQQTYEIWPRLFLGRAPFPNEAFEQDLLIHCEAWWPDGVTCRGGPCAMVHGPFKDCSDASYKVIAENMAIELSRIAVLAWREGKSVRISCLAGLNRSALVMGVVLLRLGLSPDAALTRIRWKRASAFTLSNELFVQILRTLDVSSLSEEGPTPLFPKGPPLAMTTNVLALLLFCALGWLLVWRQHNRLVRDRARFQVITLLAVRAQVDLAAVAPSVPDPRKEARAVLALRLANILAWAANGTLDNPSPPPRMPTPEKDLPHDA